MFVWFGYYNRNFYNVYLNVGLGNFFLRLYLNIVLGGLSGFVCKFSGLNNIISNLILLLIEDYD